MASGPHADGALDANENHLISKVAGLLHVTHGDYIDCQDARQRGRTGPGLSHICSIYQSYMPLSDKV